jgi:hypothetical protein
MNAQSEAQRAPERSKHSHYSVVGIKCKASGKATHSLLPEGIQCKMNGKKYVKKLGERKKRKFLKKKADERNMKRIHSQSRENEIALKEEKEGTWCTTLITKSKISWKETLKFATWNVRTMGPIQFQKLIFSDLHKYKIAAAAVQESRWEQEVYDLRKDGYACYGGGAWKNSTWGISWRSHGGDTQFHSKCC